MVQTKTGIFEAMAQESSQYRMLSTQDAYAAKHRLYLHFVIIF